MRTVVPLAVAAVALLGAIAVVGSPAVAAALAGAVAALALAASAAAHLLESRRRALGALPRQFTAIAGVTVLDILLAIAVFAAVMAVDIEEALVFALVAVVSGLLATLAAHRLAGGVLADIRDLRDGLTRVGEGRRDVSIAVGGRDELSELAAAANAMIERLGAEEATRRHLLAAISHDLRTPITSLRLLAAALGEGDGDSVLAPDERRAYLQRMETHLRALNALIDDLFELARLEAGEVRWPVEPVPLGMLVGDTVDALHPQAESLGVALRYDVPDVLPPVRGNPEKLQRVLFNLLRNSLAHTPAGGEIDVLAEAIDGSVEVEVADTGAGIRDTDRDHVFRAFYRGGAEAARGGEGAGLGLAIARAIVEAHDGYIWLADAAGGTRVRFSLPRAA